MTLQETQWETLAYIQGAAFLIIIQQNSVSNQVKRPGGFPEGSLMPPTGHPRQLGMSAPWAACGFHLHTPDPLSVYRERLSQVTGR